MPITQAFLNKAANVAFTNAADIDNFFTQQNNGQDFISWFNANLSKKKFWADIKNNAGKVIHSAIVMSHDSMAHDRFNHLWSEEGIQTIFGKNTMSLLQFLSLQSIINNETGGSLNPLTEGVGRPPLHPGISYAFDIIPGTKISYNTITGNKTCLALFNDANYNKAFQNLPLGSQLKNTTNKVWAGEAYPIQTVPTSTNPAVTGYVLEADFFKFRGRGFIQTTGRANYSSIVDFIMKYTGSNPVINNMKAAWAQRSNNTDILATVSTNAEWDNLFQNTSGLIAAKSIEVHNRASTDYLGKINGADPIVAASTIRNVGKRISGGNNYADLFLNRVTQIIELL